MKRFVLYQLGFMNITQFLLGSTAVMLLVAIVLSYGEMKSGEKQHGLQQSASELMQDNVRLQAEIDRLRSGLVAPKQEIEVPNAMTDSKLAEIEQQNELLRQQLAAEEEMRKKNEAMALANMQPVRTAKEERRARHISIATLMAEVIETAQQGEISIILIDVKMPTQVQVNTELAIRRGDEITGRLVVSNISEGNVFADAIQGSFPAGAIDVQVGDELILEPRP